MQTLKEILIDAARYRWLRENLPGYIEDRIDVFHHCTPEQCDADIDEELKNEQ